MEAMVLDSDVRPLDRAEAGTKLLTKVPFFIIFSPSVQSTRPAHAQFPLASSQRTGPRQPLRVRLPEHLRLHNEIRCTNSRRTSIRPTRPWPSPRPLLPPCPPPIAPPRLFKRLRRCSSPVRRARLVLVLLPRKARCLNRSHRLRACGWSTRSSSSSSSSSLVLISAAMTEASSVTTRGESPLTARLHSFWL
jgi:hypothetical protein